MLSLLAVHTLGAFEICIPIHFAILTQRYLLPALVSFLWLAYLSLSGQLARRFIFLPHTDFGSETAEIQDNAHKWFCCLYAPQILFSLCLGVWLIARGQFYGIVWPVVKIVLVVRAHHQLFPLKTKPEE